MKEVLKALAKAVAGVIALVGVGFAAFAAFKATNAGTILVLSALAVALAGFAVELFADLLYPEADGAPHPYDRVASVSLGSALLAVGGMMVYTAATSSPSTASRVVFGLLGLVCIAVGASGLRQSDDEDGDEDVESEPSASAEGAEVSL